MSKKAESTGENKLKRGEKGAAIIETVLRNPGMPNKALAEKVSERGIKCTAQDVANVKNRMRRDQRGRDKHLTAEDLLKVKTLAASAGGIQKLTDSIEKVERMAVTVGGLDRLKNGIRALNELRQS